MLYGKDERNDPKRLHLTIFQELRLPRLRLQHSSVLKRMDPEPDCLGLNPDATPCSLAPLYLSFLIHTMEVMPTDLIGWLRRNGINIESAWGRSWHRAKARWVLALPLSLAVPTSDEWEGLLGVSEPQHLPDCFFFASADTPPRLVGQKLERDQI